MSMQGIGPTGLPSWLRGPDTAREKGDAAGAGRSGSAEGASRPEKATQHTRPLAPVEVPEETGAVPEGVDPELWGLLTTEERSHFARFAAMGGVTYGPTSRGSNRPPVRGHRLDLRV